MKHTALRCLLAAAISVIFPALRAQEVGSWMLYPARGSVGQVATAGDVTYALTGNTLFSYTASDESVVSYSKLDGMSSTLVSHIAYAPDVQTLVIVYSNYDIDLLRNGEFRNIPDLKERVMTGSKAVNSINIEGSTALLATDFGILAIDLTNALIRETYQNGHAALTAFTFGGNICSAGTDGIWMCPLGGNPYNKNEWKHVATDNLKATKVIGDALFALNTDGTLIKFDTTWTKLATSGSYTGLASDNNDGLLYLYNTSKLTVLDANLQTQLSLTTAETPIALSAAKEGQLWLGSDTGLNGLRRSGEAWESIEEQINISSTSVASAYDMRFDHDRLYAVSGGPFRLMTEIPGQVSILDNGSWLNFNASIPELPTSSFFALNDIAVSPTDPTHFVVGSKRKGIIEFRDDAFYQQIMAEDDYLTSSSSSRKNDYVWASAVQFDPKGNLWVVNSVVEQQLRVREASTGNWYKYTIPNLGKVGDLRPLLITKHGQTEQFWFTSYYNYLSLNVFEHNNTLDNTADDKAIFIKELTDQDGNVYNYDATFYFHTVAEDLDGKIWIGTNIGLFTISSPHNVFSTEGQCTRPKVPRNDGTGLADYLLADIPVTVIAVDAANRKWVGTSGNGVYLLSADGLEEIHHFTTDNSMLPSDVILSIAIDDNSGRVYFGTDGMIASYQSDATKGADDFSEVYAYPNPVRPDYTGDIIVRGLMDNTLVKITDLNNNLIYQSTSLGGQFSWDGLNRRGERVKSGVYLVYGSSEDGKQGVVTKIMIIR